MPKPDSSTKVRVDGHEVVTYSYGDAHAEVLFLLNGGPGWLATICASRCCAWLGKVTGS
jgi:hypothetical protein